MSSPITSAPVAPPSTSAQISSNQTQGRDNIQSTPKRHGSYYASPHTPIASAKRPREPSSARRQSLTYLPEEGDADGDVSGIRPRSVEGVEDDPTPASPDADLSAADAVRSPLHPPRVMVGHDAAVPCVSGTRTRISPGKNGGYEDGESLEQRQGWQRKMDALFSPVLHFFGNEGEEEHDGSETPESEDPPSPGEGAEEMIVVSPTPPKFDVKEVEDVSTNVHPTLEVNDSMSNSPQPPPAVTTDDTSVAEPQAATPVESRPPSPVAMPDNTRPAHPENDADVVMDEEDSLGEEYEEFNPYLFIKQLPDYELVAVPDKICLPPKRADDKPIALVLDLDETLVHCTVEPIPNPDMVFPVEFGGVEYQVHVRKRPHLERFLRRAAADFEVIVFTASQKVYADELLDRLDPEGKYIKHRMFRESCLPVEGNYLKDLNVLGRDLGQAVLVDNSPHAFGYQVDNGIPIESWFDDPNDTELVKLETFLSALVGVPDVRPFVREKFRTFKLIEEA